MNNWPCFEKFIQNIYKEKQNPEPVDERKSGKRELSQVNKDLAE